MDFLRKLAKCSKWGRWFILGPKINTFEFFFKTFALSFNEIVPDAGIKKCFRLNIRILRNAAFLDPKMQKYRTLTKSVE